MNKLVSTGIIKYDPPRRGMKRRTKWWVVAYVDKEITRYFRWWVKKTFWIDLYPPAWDAHISIVRGERPSDELLSLWGKYDKKQMTFTYSLNVVRSEIKSDFWIVEIHSEEMMNIRRELKLRTTWPLHLTIGRTYDGVGRL